MDNNRIKFCVLVVQSQGAFSVALAQYHSTYSGVEALK